MTRPVSPFKSSTRNGVTIGVRDSGVGGLTVARCLKEALPHARLLYFADTAHVPYGGRQAEEVRHFALSIADFLISQGAQIVVFACNTSSALALETAQNTLSVPVFGTIEPGARAAIEVSRNGRIGVLATQATVESGVYASSILARKPEFRVLEIACPLFVPLVESEQTESEEAHAAALKYLRPLVEFGADAVVLGCTHYPLLLPVLQSAARKLGAPQLRFVDPAQTLARDMQQILHEEIANASEIADSEIVAQDDIFFVSGESDGVRRWVQNLLKNANPQFENGPIFELRSVETATL